MFRSSHRPSRPLVSVLIVAAALVSTVFVGAAAHADAAPPPERRGIVERVAGADRYEVSAAISAKTFPTGAPVAGVVSGTVFSDALSASAAMGLEGGGVLLVTRDTIPPAIAADLGRLQPAAIVIVGGTATISREVETALEAYAPVVRRIAGADRYEVTAAVADASFPRRVPVAYVAPGQSYPDALSGAAAAGLARGPVVLTQKEAVPAPVLAYLTRNHPRLIVLLGGSDSVSDSVFFQLAAIAPISGMAEADRYDVSAKVSSTMIADDSGPTVSIASGADFADALSAGPAAILAGGPILLVTKDAIPSSVAAEIARMNPAKVIVLGGENSVSASVVAALGRA